MTSVDALAEVRARLERMIELAAAATPGPWTIEQDGDLDWSLVGTANDGRLLTCGYGTDAEADTAYIAAASPDLLLRVAQEAIYILNRHGPNDMGECGWCGFAWPCVDVAGALKAWLP